MSVNYNNKIGSLSQFIFTVIIIIGVLLLPGVVIAEDDLYRDLDALKKFSARRANTKISDELQTYLQRRPASVAADVFLSKFFNKEGAPVIYDTGTVTYHKKHLTFGAVFRDANYIGYHVKVLIPRPKFKGEAKIGLIDDFYQLEKRLGNASKVGVSSNGLVETFKDPNCIAHGKLPGESAIIIEYSKCDESKDLDSFLASYDLNELINILKEIENERH